MLAQLDPEVHTVINLRKMLHELNVFNGMMLCVAANLIRKAKIQKELTDEKFAEMAM